MCVCVCVRARVYIKPSECMKGLHTYSFAGRAYRGKATIDGGRAFVNILMYVTQYAYILCVPPYTHDGLCVGATVFPSPPLLSPVIRFRVSHSFCSAPARLSLSIYLSSSALPSQRPSAIYLVPEYRVGSTELPKCRRAGSVFIIIIRAYRPRTPCL